MAARVSRDGLFGEGQHVSGPVVASRYWLVVTSSANLRVITVTGLCKDAACSLDICPVTGRERDFRLWVTVRRFEVGG